jgi:hypothetical protein
VAQPLTKSLHLLVYDEEEEEKHHTKEEGCEGDG